MDLVIKNARVVTEAGVIHGGIAVEGERISYVGPSSELPSAKRVIDAREHFAIPGFIDAHVHLGGGRKGSPAEVLAAAFPVETRGALYGGVTTAGSFISTNPREPIGPRAQAHRDVGNALSHIDFFTHAVVTSEMHVEEIPSLAHEYGCWSFKPFFNANKPRYAHDEMPTHPGIEHDLLFRSLETLARLGSPALGMVHCEDQDLIWVLEDRLKTAGRKDLRAWAEARRAGYPYWGETCPHYLTHTADMEDEVGCWGRVNTAIKFERDRDRLWDGIKDGSITNMGTDHGSFPRDLKEGGGGKHNNIWGARSGIAGGMEHWLPVMMTYGVNAGRITIEEMARVCSTNNAKVFGLYPRKGALRVGADADIVLVDPEREATISKDFYHGAPDWSIYDGWNVKGMARLTLLRGQVMLDEYEAVGEPGAGRYVVPGQ
jgi:dihydropyrimidinase/dihydroorotase